MQTAEFNYMFSPRRLVEDAIPSEFKLEPVFEVLSVDSRLGFNIRAVIIRTWFSGVVNL